MEKRLNVGGFCFDLSVSDGLELPDDFALFETPDGVPEYSYKITAADTLPVPAGKVLAKRPDMTVFLSGELEGRMLGTRLMNEQYACYQETAGDAAEITFCAPRMQNMMLAPMFTSMLAPERRFISRGGLIFHCAYLRHDGEAILFSGPSGIGKSTQADLWVKYANGEVINGDRALLTNADGHWMANGWPVSGSSGICKNITLPVKAIVMLEQSKENRVRRIAGVEAISLLYAQTTVNSWNVSAVERAMDLLESLTVEVPIYHLSCDISKEAVSLLKQKIYLPNPSFKVE